MVHSGGNLRDLFHRELKDIYFAEKQILRALPKMARNAQSSELQHAFETHADETEQQIERLDRVFESIGQLPRGKTCDAIIGLLDEGKEIMEEFADTEALDPGLLAAAQSVEHYEISRYGTLKAWAEQLGLTEAAQLLDATLVEEKRMDEILTKIAMVSLNEQAA
ncbi:ferritin-like domain-containing protein [Beijerinckia indica]|uniref:Uncharacterized protein n=1 Tax=Beijerinckia indica subsp. indica (strain ATCC 9039 / DSM 1715 / NCIMB 8712) TaxID=395963 RepID=B2IL09_BEII9|nr:ferritin-like domain-containing protein [Beijerinckia indica]ACB96549.1 protein of unknown function DUF892 [Beijerinckia indica subsp. indica ATCC 9039]